MSQRQETWRRQNVNKSQSTVARPNKMDLSEATLQTTGSCHKRRKPQAPTPQVPIRNRQTRKVANAKGLNRNTNLN